jgi:hypothetical protein
MRTASGSASHTRPDIDLTDLWGRIPGPQVIVAGHGPDGHGILLVGDGPRTCTSVRTVASRRLPRVYDVNGFYEALGVATDADRVALSAAYLARGGQSDRRLTEILMILRDPHKRAAYDRMLPHQRFAESELIAHITRAEAYRVIREHAPLSSVFEPRNMDFETPNTRESGSEYGQDVPRWDAGRITAEADSSWWGYAYYLWGVTYSASAVAHLPLWQQMLITALGDDGGPGIRFAVGRSTLGSAPTAIRVQEVPVAFLSAGTAPQQNLAEHVASQLRALVTQNA